MEVTKHFVRAPSAEKADDVGVDVGAEESVGASSLEAAGRVTSVGRNPSEGPRNVTAVRRAAVISLGLMRDHLGAMK